jgi:hypothetical protein
MLKKVVYAASRSTSFVEAVNDLQALGELLISRERVQRWAKRIGRQRVAQLEQQAAAYQDLPLPERRESPADQVPQVACVQMDGGRIQIRKRDEEASNQDGEKGYWRESLVGCCLSMISQEHAEDPCPTIPETFVNAERMHKLSREIKGFSESTATSEATSVEASDERAGRPEVLVKSVIATRQGVETLGARLVAAAHARGFHAAKRKAFVADGGASNWGVHKKHFSHYVPILDFTHAICYVYQAAMAGRAGAGWNDYCQWAQWLWEGKTQQLIDGVAGRTAELGPPGESDSETSPRQIVATTLGYLHNQRSRMKYAEYRRLGLPITSSHIESTIKQINRRVKGTDKFWDQGAEPLLQLVADHQSQTLDLDRFWRGRPKQLKRMRCYQTAA